MTSMVMGFQEAEKRNSELQDTQDMQKQLLSHIDLSGALLIVEQAVNSVATLAVAMDNPADEGDQDSNTSDANSNAATTAAAVNGSTQATTSTSSSASSSSTPSNEQLLFESLEAGLQGMGQIEKTSNTNQSGNSTENGN